VTWSSSDTGVATISNAAGSNGLVTAVAAGSTTITATSGGISKSRTLTVTAASLTSIAVIPVDSSIAIGALMQFTATGTYSDNTTQDLTTSATWSSSDTSVATISNAAGSIGLATAVFAGSTTITAVSGSVSGSTTLTVTGTAGTSAVTLTWGAPATYTDGTPATLAAVAGYKIYYGTSSGTYTKSADVASAGTTPVTYTLNLSPGTYYFVVTAIGTDGQESDHSNEISTTI
jgi:uncharacterized protein YjdB